MKEKLKTFTHKVEEEKEHLRTKENELLKEKSGWFQIYLVNSILMLIVLMENFESSVAKIRKRQR